MQNAQDSSTPPKPGTWRSFVKKEAFSLELR